KKKTSETCTYTFVPKETKVNWTGYKHANRTAVPGIFETVNFEGGMNASSIHELLLGIEGTVETSSVYSNDTTRDRKLQQFFFDQMENAGKISARMVDMSPVYDAEGNAEGIGKIEINMNGVSFTVPANFVIKGTTVTVDADFSVDEFQVDKPYQTISEACSEKHTLESEGKAVTWAEFHVNISTRVVKTCE